MHMLKMAVMWHGVAFLPHLRAMKFEALRAVCNVASDLSGQRVLHMQPDVSSREFEIEGFPWHNKLSGAQVIAVMVYGLWVLCGEREEMCSSLVEAWPIREALILSPTPSRDGTDLISQAEFEAALRETVQKMRIT